MNIIIPKCLITSLAVFVLSATSLLAESLPTPLLFFGFENRASGESYASTDSSVSINGASLTTSTYTPTDMLSTAGAGLGGGYALNVGNVGNTYNNSARFGLYFPSTTTIGTLTSFTVTGWLKGNQYAGSTLFQYGTSSQISIGISNGVLSVKVNNTSITSSSNTTLDNLLKTDTQWVFFAVSYDNTSTTNNLTYFIGKADGTSSSIVLSSAQVAQGTGTGAGDRNMIIGNSLAYNNAYRGMMDDFALYGATSGSSGALSLENIQAIYDAQRLTTSIPEPTTAALFLSSSALAVGVLIRRRNVK